MNAAGGWVGAASQRSIPASNSTATPKMSNTAAIINQAITDASGAAKMKSVSVKNLPRDMPNLTASIRNVFENFGLVRDVYVPTDRYTGLPIGFGFVEFIDPADAIKAVAALHRGFFLSGKRVHVALAEGRRKMPEEMLARPTQPIAKRLYAATMLRLTV